MTYKPTAKSYFSGAGGMDYGLKIAGVDILQSYEIDSKCTNVLKKNFDHEILESDIQNLTVKDQPESDIMIGTFPCTKYSTAANIHGTRTGDVLFLHMFRHIALAKPEVYVIENVPGMKKFPIVMEALSKLPDYFVNIFCPLKTENWLPQRRDRLILIGSRKEMKINLPNTTRKSIRLKYILEKDPQIDIPKYVANRLLGKGNYRDKPIISDPNDINSIAPTCIAHYAKDRSTRLVMDKNFKHGVRPYTPKEYARL